MWSLLWLQYLWHCISEPYCNGLYQFLAITNSDIPKSTDFTHPVYRFFVQIHRCFLTRQNTFALISSFLYTSVSSSLFTLFSSLLAFDTPYHLHPIEDIGIAKLFEWFSNRITTLWLTSISYLHCSVATRVFLKEISMWAFGFQFVMILGWFVSIKIKGLVKSPRMTAISVLYFRFSCALT